MSARPITPASLERTATHYLERYGASREMLRRALVRHVRRRCRERGEDPAAFLPLVEAAVARAAAAGLVDDRAFATARAARLRRRGGSARRIAQALAAKGVDAETAGHALSAAAEGDAEAAEADAARAYARRRRLGPFRPEAERRLHRERDLAALARAGFSLALARATLDATLDD